MGAPEAAAPLRSVPFSSVHRRARLRLLNRALPQERTSG